MRPLSSSPSFFFSWLPDWFGEVFSFSVPLWSVKDLAQVSRSTSYVVWTEEASDAAGVCTDYRKHCTVFTCSSCFLESKVTPPLLANFA